MHADTIRRLYEYHFTMNRNIREEGVVLLTDEQFRPGLLFSVMERW